MLIKSIIGLTEEAEKEDAELDAKLYDKSTKPNVERSGSEESDEPKNSKAMENSITNGTEIQNENGNEENSKPGNLQENNSEKDLEKEQN